MKYTLMKHAAAQTVAVAATAGLAVDNLAGIERYIAIGITVFQMGLAVIGHLRTPQGRKITTQDTMPAEPPKIH